MSISLSPPAPLFSIGISNTSNTSLQPANLEIVTDTTLKRIYTPSAQAQKFTVSRLIKNRENVSVKFFVLRESEHSDDNIVGYLCAFENENVNKLSYYHITNEFAENNTDLPNNYYLFETSSEDSTLTWADYKDSKTTERIQSLSKVYHFGHNLLDYLDRKESPPIHFYFQYTSFKNMVHKSELNNIMKVITCEKYLSLTDTKYDFKKNALNNIFDNDEYTLYNVVNVQNSWDKTPTQRESDSSLESFFSHLAVKIIKAWVVCGIPQIDTSNIHTNYLKFVAREIQIVLDNTYHIDLENTGSEQIIIQSN